MVDLIVHFGTDNLDLIQATINLDHPLIELKFESFIAEMNVPNMLYRCCRWAKSFLSRSIFLVIISRPPKSLLTLT